MLAKAPTKTRAQWAKQICASAQRTVDSILETGRLLIAAKKALDHGEFESMIANDLPFDASTARRQMKIARDPRISAHGHVLPAAWRTIYELTMLPDDTIPSPM
jgi:hypothetical protein